MYFFQKIVIATILGTGAIALAACESEAPAQQGSPPPIFASVVTVDAREVPVSYEYAGRVAPVKETQVRARVGGILLRRNFTEGARVYEGDLLFEIDPATYEAEVARQNALVAQAEANYKQVVRDAERSEQLLKKKVISAAQRDQAIAIRDAAAATLQQAQAALKMAKINLDYTRVTAPIDGVTSREAVSEGSLIAINGLLTTITQNDPVYINFSYTDSESREIAQIMQKMRERGEHIEQLQVRIRFGDGTEYDKLGVIDFTSPTLDAQTGTLGARASVDNKEQQLVPGQFVRVSVVGLKLGNAIVIPEKALMQDSGGTFVYVVDEKNIIEKRAVRVMRQIDNRDWVIEPVEVVNVETFVADPTPAEVQAVLDLAQTQLIGLKSGERIVTEGHFRIQMALGQMPPDVPLGVTVTTLDGQDLRPPVPTDRQIQPLEKSAQDQEVGEARVSGQDSVQNEAH